MTLRILTNKGIKSGADFISIIIKAGESESNMLSPEIFLVPNFELR